MGDSIFPNTICPKMVSIKEFYEYLQNKIQIQRGGGDHPRHPPQRPPLYTVPINSLIKDYNFSRFLQFD